MQSKIEDTTFKNFVVPFGGAFYIVNSIDLVVKKLNIINIISLSFYTFSNWDEGGPGFIFSGNNFQGSQIFANNLSSSYSSIFFAYSSSSYSQVINSSSVSDCACYSRSIFLGKYSCISDDVNVTECSVQEKIATIHFGWNPSSYYQENFIGCNNTGQTILGHSSSSTAESKCENIVLINNNASNGVIGFWCYNHQLINSYFLGNTGLQLLECSKDVAVTFERCYNEGITGVTETDSKTYYQTCISITMFQYDQYHKEMIKETCKKLIKHMHTYHRHEFKPQLIIYIIEISE